MKRISARLSLVAAIFLVFACQGKTSGTKNVFGNDERVSVSTGQMPYAALGRLDQGCTGTMIGQNLLLTAAHCLIDNSTGQLRSANGFFKSAFENGHSAGDGWMIDAWVGSVAPETNRLTDWAIVRLDQALGANGKILAIDPTPITTFPHAVALAGYSGDLNHGDAVSVTRQCQLMELVEERYLHACDATAGISGASLLSDDSINARVIGISVSEFRQGAANSVTRPEYSRDYANVGVPASRFAAVANALLAQADGANIGVVPTIAGAVYVKNNRPRPANGATPPPATIPVTGDGNNPGGPAPLPNGPNYPNTNPTFPSTNPNYPNTNPNYPNTTYPTPTPVYPNDPQGIPQPSPVAKGKQPEPMPVQKQMPQQQPVQQPLPAPIKKPFFGGFPRK